MQEQPEDSDNTPAPAPNQQDQQNQPDQPDQQDQAQANEQVQEEAAKERESERGYQ
jgi:hypothetical protein